MNEKVPKQNSGVHFVRHGEAKYGPDLVSMHEPSQPMGKEVQAGIKDLTDDGVRQMIEGTESFLGSLDPSKDVLLIVASPAARAQQSAEIIKNRAESTGFSLAEGGQVKTIDALKPLNMRIPSYLSDIFSTATTYEEHYYTNGSLDAAKVFDDPAYGWSNKISDSKKRELWIRAKNIVSSDDRGSWGANFAAHSDTVAELYPEVNFIEARKLSEEVSQQCSRWLAIAEGRFDTSENKEKRLVIISVGHEEYINALLEKGKHIGNAQFVDAKNSLRS